MRSSGKLPRLLGVRSRVKWVNTASGTRRGQLRPRGGVSRGSSLLAHAPVVNCRLPRPEVARHLPRSGNAPVRGERCAEMKALQGLSAADGVLLGRHRIGCYLFSIAIDDMHCAPHSEPVCAYRIVLSNACLRKSASAHCERVFGLTQGLRREVLLGRKWHFYVHIRGAFQWWLVAWGGGICKTLI